MASTFTFTFPDDVANILARVMPGQKSAYVAQAIRAKAVREGLINENVD